MFIKNKWLIKENKNKCSMLRPNVSLLQYFQSVSKIKKAVYMLAEPEKKTYYNPGKTEETTAVTRTAI